MFLNEGILVIEFLYNGTYINNAKITNIFVYFLLYDHFLSLVVNCFKLNFFS